MEQFFKTPIENLESWVSSLSFLDHESPFHSHPADRWPVWLTLDAGTIAGTTAGTIGGTLHVCTKYLEWMQHPGPSILCTFA